MVEKKITISDIAKQANVSIATVSRIINNKDTVKPETREQVLNVMNKLNFSPKSHSTLSQSNSKTILMLVPDFINPFNGPVIEGVQNVALSSGYRVLLMQDIQYYSESNNYEDILKNNSIAGIIIFCSIPNSKFVEDLSYRCPVVMCSEYAENNSTSYVGIDDVKAAKKAVNYLISTGCRKIGLINCSMNFKYAKHRERGYREALNNAGLPINPDWIAHIPSINYNIAYSSIMQIINMHNTPDALFACSDVFAFAGINAAHKSGIRVPEDLSIIGFDNIYLSTMSNPTITTIEQPCYQLGYQACELLLEKIKFPEIRQKKIILNTELIVRNSTKL